MEEEREIIDQIYNNLPKQVTTQEGNQSLETMRTLTTVGTYGSIGGGFAGTTTTGAIIACMLMVGTLPISLPITIQLLLKCHFFLISQVEQVYMDEVE